MRELEKVLEEIENLKEMYKESEFALLEKGDLLCAYDKSDIESEKAKAISEAIEIIRKYIDDDKCEKCSRSKWCLKGYEDGKNNNDGWISVADRLPENNGDNGELIVTDKDGRVQSGIYYGIAESRRINENYSGSKESCDEALKYAGNLRLFKILSSKLIVFLHTTDNRFVAAASVIETAADAADGSRAARRRRRAE